MTERPIHLPGTIPLPEGVPELRAERFERLRMYIEDTSNMACAEHDQTRRGGPDRYGRFAVHFEDGDGPELTRCSSLKRAGNIAEHLVCDEATIHGAYDLDRLVNKDDPEALPVCHKLAAVHIIVVFNTVAS